MKKHLLTNFLTILTVFMMSTMIVFANGSVEGNMTSSEFLAKSNSQGDITLSDNVALSDARRKRPGNPQEAKNRASCPLEYGFACPLIIVPARH